MANMYHAMSQDTALRALSGRETLAMPFPMGKYMAQVVIPRDMTQDECDRLCAMLQTLVIPVFATPTRDIQVTPQESEQVSSRLCAD